MLTDEEKAFIDYWEQNRQRERRVMVQLMIGLPLGLVFAVPILMNFLSGWYTRANMVGVSQSSPLIMIIAILAIAVFVAIFSKRHRWEMNEQRYQELKEIRGKDVSQ